MICIDILGVKKAFRTQVVLDGIDLHLTGGNIYGVVGRNGSGKSVLMKCICGLLPVSEGEIRINGQKISPGKPLPEFVGAIIESPGFLPYLSGFANLKSLNALRRSLSDSQIREKMEEIGLDSHSRKSVRKYSLGMKQKLGILQATMEDQKILLLDEPMNGLDAAGVETVRALLMRKKAEGTLILIATHVQEDVNLLCDEVYRVENGQLRAIEKQTLA